MPPALEAAACCCTSTATTGRVIVARDAASGELFQFVTCATCGAERLDPRPGRAAIGAYYPDGYASHIIRPDGLGARLKHLIYLAYHAPENRLGWRRPWLRLALYPLRGRGVMLFTPVAPRRVFEFGAATGNDLALFRAEGWQVDGCEPSARACAMAAARGIALQNTTAEAAELAPASVSAVLINNVLEHVHDPAAVLAKAWQGLVAGGTLVIVVPNHAGPSARLFGAAWPGYDAPRHLWGFTPASLTALLAQLGFAAPVIHQLPQGAWAWQTALDGSRAPTPAPAWRHRHARHLALALLPLGVLAAWCGRGDFMTVIARRPA